MRVAKRLRGGDEIFGILPGGNIQLGRTRLLRIHALKPTGILEGTPSKSVQVAGAGG